MRGQIRQLRAGVDSDPQDARMLRGRKDPDIVERQRESGTPHGVECAFNRTPLFVFDIAKELERDMQSLGTDPSRTVDPGLYDGNEIHDSHSNLCRDLDSHEESH